ncbi:hypothetical protein LBMAG42_01220 [Deltaproteobacteria bacterium]|nr:hypothetical protein LBMAG42_01220 [Deltaproteobacteria bacterium]
MAKKNNGKSAKRAAKKHQKEVKRRKAVALRGRAAAEPLAPHEAWRPAREGIEGLAARMGISVHSAGGLAEHLAKKHGRHEAADLWLPSRLRAMDVPALVAALAERGIVTDEARFREAAAPYTSARSLAEIEWFPLLSERHGVHDRDFCGQAATRLWSEWYLECASDEQLADQLDRAEDALWGEDPEEAVQQLLTAWGLLEPESAPRRLAGAELLARFLKLAEAAVAGDFPELELQPETRASLGDVLRRLQADLRMEEELELQLSELLDDIDWSQGQADAVITRLLEATVSSGDPMPVMDAAALVLAKNDASHEQYQRVREAVEAALATVPDELREDMLAWRDELDGALADGQPE